MKETNWNKIGVRGAKRPCTAGKIQARSGSWLGFDVRLGCHTFAYFLSTGPRLVLKWSIRNRFLEL